MLTSVCRQRASTPPLVLLNESELRSPRCIEPLTTYSKRYANIDTPSFLNGDALGQSNGAALTPRNFSLTNDMAIDRARQLVVSGSGFGVCGSSAVDLCVSNEEQNHGGILHTVPCMGTMHSPQLSQLVGGFLLQVPCPGIPQEDIRVDLVGSRTVCVKHLAHSEACRAGQTAKVEQVVTEKSVTLPQIVDENRIACRYADGLLCVTISSQQTESGTCKESSALLEKLEQDAVAAAARVEKVKEELRKETVKAAEALGALRAAQEAAKSICHRLPVL